MLRSMTGYGREVLELGDHTVTLEIRSLNNKFLDLTVRLPQEFRYQEMALRKQLQPRLIRGKVDLTITLETIGGNDRQELNHDAIRYYHQELSTLARDLDLHPHDLLTVIMRLPNVTIPSRPLDAEELWVRTAEALDGALLKFEAFRSQEGANLVTDMTERLQALRLLREDVAEKSGERLVRVRQRLEQQLVESLGPGKVDENRFEQELIYYLEKLDLNEELVRLSSHLEYYQESLNNDDPETGKKLGFIAQEMGREINTLGSKANDAFIQQQVVRMKDELEKLKEQALNVL
jgi:uncharacterized protein (TIGR00255 family)